MKKIRLESEDEGVPSTGEKFPLFKNEKLRELALAVA
jgi:hypothetical protein